MSTSTLHQKLFQYHAWANAEFLNKMHGFDLAQLAAEQQAALRVMNHVRVVGEIFAAHLTGRTHGYASDNTEHTPTLAELQAALQAVDHWYLDYVQGVSAQALAEPVRFVFTDGDKACMTREEMLTHVLTHAGYHRGEVGRIMKQCELPMPWDTYAVFLHSTEPARRMRAA